jgi:hypothetical protein
MQTDLRIEMEMVGEGQVRVQMESEAGGQGRLDTIEYQEYR